VSTTLTSTVSTTTTATTSFIAMLPYSFLPAALAIMILAGLPNPILGRVGPRLSRRKMH
jgi:hypothetical protein